MERVITVSWKGLRVPKVLSQEIIRKIKKKTLQENLQILNAIRKIPGLTEAERLALFNSVCEHWFFIAEGLVIKNLMKKQ